MILACSSIVLAGHNAFAGRLGAALSAKLSGMSEQNEVEVIVRLTSGPPAFGPGEVSRGNRSAAVDRVRRKGRQALTPLLTAAHRGGASRVEELWAIGGAVIKGKPGLIRALAKRDDVAVVTLNRQIALIDEPPAQAALEPPPGEWNMALIGASALWARGVTGEGAVVAILDSGADIDHTDLALGWVGLPSGWYDPSLGSGVLPDLSMIDDHHPLGHGTEVVGVVSGRSSSGTTLGVAPGSTWMMARIFDGNLAASIDDIHLAFQWALDPDGDPTTDDIPDVVNCSWGIPSAAGTCDTTFEADIAALNALGVPVIFAAGNSGPITSTDVPPANNQGALAVGAVDSSAFVIPASSRGPSSCDGSFFPHLVAPGQHVYTAALSDGLPFPNQYTLSTGTSIAAPHVAGAVALLKGAFPDASLASIEGALTQTAQDLGASGADNESGYGLVNVEAAFESLVPAGCADSDLDGFFDVAGCGTPVDCDDQDIAINPLAKEICGNAIDNDCDTLIDLDDPDCPVTPTASASSGSGSGGCFMDMLGRSLAGD